MLPTFSNNLKAKCRDKSSHPMDRKNKGILAVHWNQPQPRCKVKVTERMQNSYGTMHGGCTVPLVQTTNQAPVARIARRLFQVISSDFIFTPTRGNDPI